MVKMNNEERSKANGILDGAFLLLILAIIIIIIMLVKGINTNHDLQNDIDKLQAEKDKRVEQNEDLKDSDKIDISGKVVGNGDSPISTFESTNMPTKTHGELMQIVEQTREGDSSENKTFWYKISNNDNNQYNVTEFESYSEVN